VFPHIDLQLAAIAHPTRRAILQLALERERSAGELADAFAVTRPAVSQHVRILVGAGLLEERRDRQRRLYRVDQKTLAAFRESFDALWTTSLARLKATVEADARSARGALGTRRTGGQNRSSVRRSRG
jgi:DNA-binding transcriptional ArsR family regulator